MKKVFKCRIIRIPSTFMPTDTVHCCLVCCRCHLEKFEFIFITFEVQIFIEEILLTENLYTDSISEMQIKVVSISSDIKFSFRKGSANPKDERYL